MQIKFSTYGFMGSVKYKGEKMSSIHVHSVMNKNHQEPTKEVKVSHARITNWSSLCGKEISLNFPF